MKTSELNKILIGAESLNWFKEIEETFDFPYIDFKQPLKGVSAIFEFLNQQIKGWGKIGSSLGEISNHNIYYFQNIKDHIIGFVNNYLNQPEDHLLYYWQNVRNLISTTNTFPLAYNSPYVDFLIKVNNESPQYFSGAYNFILGINYSTSDKNLLYGAILAYEFTLKDKTEIANRKEAERASIARIRNDFQKYLTESEGQLIDHLKNSEERYNDYVKRIDDLKSEKEDLFTSWFETTKTEDWDTWYKAAKENIKRLESTYEMKLKLEKPARYWQIKSTQYFEQGKNARTILLWLVGISAIFLGAILTVSPKWIFSNVFNGNTVAIVRWSLIFITLLTLIAFSIRAISKYMFSSYHLARDAEERHTLTFFYLALSKDSEIKDDDRKLILQALFSRVETGLLKDDGSPTMPSDTISKIISK